MQSLSFGFRGLWIEGGAEYDRGDYWNPPSGDMEIDSITLDDPEEFASWCLLEDFSEGVSNMVDAYHRITGKLLPAVERIVWKQWEDDIREAGWEAFDSWEPDYDDDRDDD